MLARSAKRGLGVAVARAGAPVAGGAQVREMSDSIVDKIKNFFVFFPKGKNYEVFATKEGVTERAKGYRYPSPGERGKDVNVPDSLEDPYNIQYYTRDTARNPDPTIFAPTPENIKALDLGNKPITKDGSKGNKNPAVLRYDPTGTRSAMTTTWEAMDNELAKHAPDHLPTAWWAKEQIEDYAEYSLPRGLPPRAGRPMVMSGQKPSGNW